MEKLYTIYKATNIKNGKSYIGFAENFEKRKELHFRDFLKKKTKNKIFYKAIQKYGWDSFEWEEIFQSKKEGNFLLKEMETYFIKQYNSHISENGYNMTYGGEGSLGKIVSKETKEKHRKNKKEWLANPENISLLKEKTKKGMKIWWESLSENEKNEYKKKCSINSKGRIKGFKHSQKTKEKISLSKIGKKRKPFSFETKQKISKSKIGKNMGINNAMSRQEIKEKQRKACIGRKKMYRENGTWFWYNPNKETIQ